MCRKKMQTATISKADKYVSTNDTFVRMFLFDFLEIGTLLERLDKTENGKQE